MLGPVETEDEAHERALADAIGADHRDSAARRDAQLDVAYYRALVILEAHPGQPEVSAELDLLRSRIRLGFLDAGQIVQSN